VDRETLVGLNVNAKVFDTVSSADFVLVNARVELAVALTSVVLLPHHHHRAFFIGYCQPT
jgi:hypothetical protein